jgi:hypothetical protein
MASSASLSKSILDLPGEIRNDIYHHFFELVLVPTTPTTTAGPLPIERDDIQYASANTFEATTSLFLSSRQIGAEARTLFNSVYFSRRHYLLSSRESIYSFSRMPGYWAQNVHKIHITANGIPQGRRIFNPIKIAIVKAARASVDQTVPAITFLRARRLQLGFINLPWDNTIIRRRFTAELRLDGIPTTLEVYRCDDNRFDIILTGPLGKLDWTMIPMAQYTEHSAWEQLLARRERLLLFNGNEIPLHRMPTAGDAELPEPYVEAMNAGSELVTEVAVEVLQALGLERPKVEPWTFVSR